MRGVTGFAGYDGTAIKISTHTPHARRDLGADDNISIDTDFNSHASCEA